MLSLALPSLKRMGGWIEGLTGDTKSRDKYAHGPPDVDMFEGVV